MAKTWDDFLPLLTPLVPGVPDATAKTYLAQAAADFFARTYLWREELDPITLQSGVAVYDLGVSIRGAVIEDVRSVTMDGSSVPLVRVLPDVVPAGHTDIAGSPTHYWMVGDTAIGVYPTPDRRFVLRLTGVLKTSRAATQVDDWIYETWADALAHGAASRILNIPGKEWSSPTLAAEYSARFEKAIVGARVRANRSTAITIHPRPLV